MKPERPKQDVPKDIAADLLQSIRSGFYGDQSPKRFMQDRNFLLRNVVLWPASWLNKRGVTLPPGRYKAILLEVFQGIKQHGATGVVSFWPGYLMKCVQSHFAIHGEEYYEEGKACRAKVEAAMFACRRAQDAARAADPVASLAQAHAVLAGAHKRKRSLRLAPTSKQGTLFNL